MKHIPRAEAEQLIIIDVVNEVLANRQGIHTVKHTVTARTDGFVRRDPSKKTQGVTKALLGIHERRIGDGYLPAKGPVYQKHYILGNQLTIVQPVFLACLNQSPVYIQRVIRQVEDDRGASRIRSSYPQPTSSLCKPPSGIIGKQLEDDFVFTSTGLPSIIDEIAVWGRDHWDGYLIGN
ncbi:hypothetical protein P691DRAFT_781318 [Macrolepiota fuliginosa MF-IS2]|uniref:Uncharacterized protein n=1 Tax=Macrolepiota fuliginosa MF-IS2 TaxID=1400762 RepID=A0A9P5XP78_9AGAR|nr:hypothetical protein P691DRAFT_781318 [Macrolepiota fuliginosa MF-IS2]